MLRTVNCAQCGAEFKKAMSGSVESDRVIQLHFSRKATDADRAWLLEAINAKIAADKAGVGDVAQPSRPTDVQIDAAYANGVRAVLKRLDHLRKPQDEAAWKECEAMWQNRVVERHALSMTSTDRSAPTQDEMENYRLALAWIKGQSTDPQAKEIAETALDSFVKGTAGKRLTYKALIH